MDKFVRRQLISMDYGNYIELFRESGYDEDKYRQIRAIDLVRLIPEDPAAVDMIYTNVLLIRNIFGEECASMSMNSMKMKTDTQEQQIRIPVPSSCKSKSSMQISEISQELPGPSTSQRSFEHNDNPSDARMWQLELVSDNEQSQPSPGTSNLSSPESPPLLSLSLSLSRRRRKREAEESQLESTSTQFETQSQSQPAVMMKHPRTSGSRNFQLHIEYLQPGRTANAYKYNIAEAQKAQIRLDELQSYDQRYTNLILKFGFNKTPDLDEFLQEFAVVAAKTKLSHIVGIAFEALNPNAHVGNSELTRIANLPGKFLRQLSQMTFNFGFADTVQPKTFTLLLVKCCNLTSFCMSRGIFGVPAENHPSLPTFKIPALPNLQSFTWSKCSGVPAVKYFKTSQTCQTKEAIPFQLDFKEFYYPELTTLRLGVQIGLLFDQFDQFPKLGVFAVKSSWHKNFNPSIGKSAVEAMDLPEEISDPWILEIFPNLFPLLNSVALLKPSIPCLRSALKAFASLRITSLNLNTNYEFQSEFAAALMGVPCTNLTAADEAKLAEAKKYAHWKEFLEFLQIEIPQPQTEAIEEQDPLQLEFGLGSLRSLRTLSIIHLRRRVRFPEGDHHWTNATVLCPQLWSFKEPPFPANVLLEEITKLKGTLKACELSKFQVEKGDALEFRKIMGFQPTTTCAGLTKPRDLIPSHALATAAAAPVTRTKSTTTTMRAIVIKQEHEQ